MKAGVLVFAKSWPSMLRTVYGNHSRMLDAYLKPYPGYYLTGDACVRDADGYYWITGRIDDVINVSEHTLMQRLRLWGFTVSETSCTGRVWVL